MDDALQTKKNRILSTGLPSRNAIWKETENIGQAECFGKKGNGEEFNNDL
jgi:hypothetical protein